MNEVTLISPGVLLAGYCALVLLASLAGGWLPLAVRLTHTRLQVATSFVAGLMLGVGLLHLLPHAWHQLGAIDPTVWWLVGGFLVMFFIQRFFHFHHHDVPDEAPELKEAPAAHVDHDACCEHAHHGRDPTLADKSARRLSWGGAALGLTLHTLIDGVALAASVEAEVHAGKHGLLLGFGTFLVILLHKPFDSMAISTLLVRGGATRSVGHLVNALFALVFPLGLVLFHLGAGYTQHAPQFLGAALAFSGGTFLCIATIDLLPELQFHAHDRVKLSLALLLGIAFSALIGRFETSGHGGKAVPTARQPAGSEQEAPH
jgi:zinc and cadmium transporter